MRVLVCADMEGVAGVVSPDDVTPGHAEYERNRAYMTDEASAAVRGILAYDPDASVVVCDATHGSATSCRTGSLAVARCCVVNRGPTG